MSAKRRPETDLNHDNWADEEEPEEVGEFQKADEAELKSRVIVKAKRRIRGSDNTDGGAEAPRANVFSGFSAFAPSKPAFNFGNFSAKVAQSTPVLPASASQFTFTAPSTKVASSTEPEKSAQYCKNLEKLNKAVIDCVKDHTGDKLCDLTPIFNDYIKYAKELEDEEMAKPVIVAAKPTPTPAPTFSFANTNNSNKASEPKTLSNASTVSLGKSDNPAPFSFDKPTTGFGSSSTPSTGFFANVKPPGPQPDTSSASTSEGQTDADADDEPPKVEFTPVVESESMYSKRCKVFVKVASEFNSRGTGTLYLKNVPDNNKVQLIVRADTNLGNILLNILLVEGLPVQKMGKNNVMIVCIPTPESEPKPTSVLVRVKNEEEAEELLAEIKKHLK